LAAEGSRRVGGIDLVVVPDAEAAAAAAAALLAAAANADGSLVLAGGSTPRRAYERAAEAHADWGGAEIWFGDDRCVPPSDPRSNQRLVREALLERVLVPPLVHPVETRLPPEEAAAAYEAELRGQILDLVLLGLGPDGHTASLFPRAASLDETARLAVAVEAALEPFVERVTMTIPALASAAHVVFLAVGGEKAEAVRGAFAEAPTRDVPASLVRSGGGRTTAILDEAAASLLP
jgi:6-phosphogluconolactonase